MNHDVAGCRAGRNICSDARIAPRGHSRCCSVELKRAASLSRAEIRSRDCHSCTHCSRRHRQTCNTRRHCEADPVTSLISDGYQDIAGRHETRDPCVNCRRTPGVDGCRSTVESDSAGTLGCSEVASSDCHECTDRPEGWRNGCYCRRRCQGLRSKGQDTKDKYNN